MWRIGTRMTIPARVGCWAAVAVVAIVGDTKLSLAFDNPLVTRLVERGITLPGGSEVRLPEPLPLNDLEPDGVRERLAPIYRRHGWDRFSRRSLVAPLEIKLGTVAGDGGVRIGHTVSVWFIAYGEFARLLDSHWVEQVAADVAKESPQDAGDAYVFRELSDTELQKFALDRSEREGLRESWVYGSLSVLNRVEVQGVAHTVVTHTDDALWVAWELATGFTEAGELSNRWRSVERSELGERTLGPAQPYQGYGGYGRITRLPRPDGALLVECHVVFHEPEGWFAGSNALRAKIPLGIQENSRKFRRELRRLSLDPE